MNGVLFYPECTTGLRKVEERVADIEAGIPRLCMHTSINP